MKSIRRSRGHSDVRENMSTLSIPFSFNVCMPLPNLLRNAAMFGYDVFLLNTLVETQYPMQHHQSNANYLYYPCFI